MLLEMIRQRIDEIILAQERLPPHRSPDRFLANSPFDELPVFTLGFSSFSAELSEHPIGRKARMGLRLPCSGKITGPFPGFRRFHHPGPYRVQDHISAYFQKVTVFLDQNGLVASLEQVSVPAVIFIEELRVNAVELPHTEGKIAFRSFNQEMVMVGHATIGVTDPIMSFVDVLKCIEEHFPVMVIFKNRLLLIPAGSHMVHPVRDTIYESHD